MSNIKPAAFITSAGTSSDDTKSSRPTIPILASSQITINTTDVDDYTPTAESMPEKVDVVLPSTASSSRTSYRIDTGITPCLEAPVSQTPDLQRKLRHERSRVTQELFKIRIYEKKLKDHLDGTTGKLFTERSG